MRYLKEATAAIGLTVIAISLSVVPATAKRPMTITQRMGALNADINRDQKTGDMTKKEADDMRDAMSGIASKINKMKEKNGGKLSYKDEGKIEKSLNDLSLDIKKAELKKRVISK